MTTYEIEKYYGANGHFTLSEDGETVFSKTVEITSDTMLDSESKCIYNCAEEWAKDMLSGSDYAENLEVIELLAEEYSIELDKYL